MSLNPDLAAAIAALNKKAKRPLVISGSDLESVERLTSGALALDVVLGGGWPKNRWTEIIGDPSNGKTAIALKTVATNQAKNDNFSTVWVRAEEYDKKWATTLGVDNARIYFIDSNVMEEVYESLLKVMQSKEIDLIVVDSLPALVPAAEDEKAMEEFTVGRGAQITNKFFRKALVDGHREPGERPFTGIVINQWRQKIGVMYGDPRTTPGGVGKDYAFSVRLEVKRDEWIEIGPAKDKVRIGQRIKAKTIKNKTAPPQMSAVFDFYFEDGGEVPKGEYDFARQIVAIGMGYGIIERAGAYYRYQGKQWQGTEATLQAIREDLDLREALEQEVLSTVERKYAA